ncbi:MAG: VWA domain-containing protein [Planctomycetota bacterium]
MIPLAMHGSFPVVFGQPRYLLLLPFLVPVVIALAGRSLAGLGPGRRRLALGLRLGLVATIVLALAEVEWRGPAAAVEAVLVVDRSASIPSSCEQPLLDAVEAVRLKARPPLRPAKVVVFGADALTEAVLRPEGRPFARFESPTDADGSDLEAGIARGLEALEAGARGRLVLFSDGNQSLGDWRRAAARARAAGVPVDVVPLEYRLAREALVEKVALPSEVKAGEPFEVRVVTQASAPLRARLHLWREGALVESRELALAPGPNVERFELSLPEPGFARLQAVLEPLEHGDARQANNRADGFVYARGKARVLYLGAEADPERGQARALIEALRAQQVAVEVVSPERFPLSVGELQLYEAVLLDDVPRRALSEGQQRAIEGAVAGLGVGLVMIGGPESFGAGGWIGSPVEDALPVRLAPKGLELLLSAALVLVLDKSGSMEGQKLELTKQAAAAAAATLGERDQVGVVAFDASAGWVAALGPARDRAGLSRAIAGLAAGGGTQMAPGLRLALHALERAEANTKHVILLTDGQDGDTSCYELARRLSAAKITVSTVGIADGAENPHLKKIAALGRGRHYGVQDVARLRQVFVKETRRAARPLLSEQRFQPRRVGQPPLLAGLRDLPALEGFVRTEAKPTAAVDLLGPDDMPLLAHWSYGVGRALAFTSDARARWAKEWVAWPGYAAFWSQALRSVSKAVASESFRVNVQREGGRARLSLDAVDAAGRLLDGLDVRARVDAPGEARPRELRLVQRGAGRYEAELEAAAAGTYALTVTSRDAGGRTLQAVTTGLTVPYSNELRATESNRALLEELARSTGGRVLPAQGWIDRDPWDEATLGAKDTWRGGWQRALALAIVLLLLDVAVRRVVIDWRALFPARVAELAHPAAPGSSRRLLERVAALRGAGDEPPPAPPSPASSPPATKGAAGAPPVAPRPVPPAPGAQRQPPPAAPSPPAGDAPAADEQGSFNRLLEAKRRARREREQG